MQIKKMQMRKEYAVLVIIYLMLNAVCFNVIDQQYIVLLCGLTVPLHLRGNRKFLTTTVSIFIFHFPFSQFSFATIQDINLCHMYQNYVIPLCRQLEVQHTLFHGED